MQRTLYQPKNVDVLVSGHQMCILCCACGRLQLVSRQHPNLKLEHDGHPLCEHMRPAHRLRQLSFQTGSCTRYFALSLQGSWCPQHTTGSFKGIMTLGDPCWWQQPGVTPSENWSHASVDIMKLGL